MNWAKMLLGANVDSKSIFFKPMRVDGLSGGVLWHDLSFNNHPIDIKS